MIRCRICTSNDREQLIEDMARAMWATQKSSNPDDEWREWDESPYWQAVMRGFAEASLRILETQFASANNN